MMTTMTKNEQNKRTQKSGAAAKNRSNGKGQNLKSTRQSKAILKIKSACRNKHTIKASFKDNEGNDVKEYVHRFQSSSNLRSNCSNSAIVTTCSKTGDGRSSAKLEEELSKVVSRSTGRTSSKESVLTTGATLMSSARNSRS